MKAKEFRKFKRKIINKVTPKFVAHSVIRSNIRISFLEKDNLEFKLAESVDEQTQALALLHDNYVKSGFMQAHPSGLRITPFHMLPDTLIPIAKDGNKVVATMSVFIKSNFGLPIDSVCEIDHLFKTDDRVVEVSSLAVDQNYSGNHGDILFPMMKFMYRCNVDLIKANYELVAVNPKIAPMYEALMLFKPLKGKKSAKSYSFVNDAPAVPLLFNLDTRYETYGRAYRKAKDHNDLMKFFSSPLALNFDLKTSMIELNLPQANPEQFHFLFCQNSNVLQDCSKEQKSVLMSRYKGNTEIQNIIREH